MKSKYFALLLLVISTAFFGLVGCGDSYANLKVEVSTTEISLFDSDDAETNSTLITATVQGASDSMLKDVDFWFKDKNVAKAEVVSLDGNESTIRVTAKGAGTTVMRVTSRENSEIMSEDINVSVYRDAESMTFRDVKPTLEVGSSLKLETGTLISFTPSRVYPNEAVFSMMLPDNPLWNVDYGAAALTGVYIEDNVLYADANAQCGIAQIEAKMANGVSCAVYVMIYKSIDETAFTLYNGADEVDSLKFAINSDELNSATLTIFINDAEQNYVIRTETTDDILVAATPDEFGDFDVSVMDSGFTQLVINVDLINPVTNGVYKTFSRYYDVEIVRIAKQVIVSGPNTVATSEPVTMYVQDYYENISGSEAHILVSPPEAKDCSYEIKVLEIDGSSEGIDGKLDSLLILVSGRTYVNIKDYLGYLPYEYGELLRNDTSFYVALNGDQIKESVKLSIQANTYDDALPVVTNEITFIVKAGVREITPSTDKLEVAVDGSVGFSVDFTTSKGENIGNPTFTFEFKDNEIAKIENDPNEAYAYLVTGLKDGTTDLTIRADNGFAITITVAVYLNLTDFYLTTDRMYENSNIAEETWNAEDYVNEIDGLYDKGVTHLTVKQNATLTVSCVYAPVGSDKNSVKVYLATYDTDGTYISLSDLNAENKFSFYARKATPKDEPVQIIVRFSFNKQIDNGVWEQVIGERILYVTVYTPLSVYYWNGTNNQKNITEQLYDKNSLYYEQQDLASVELSTFINTNATVFQNGGTIEWTVQDEDLISISANGTSAKITANLDPVLNPLSRYETYVYASVVEYGKRTTLTCKVIILKPQLVESITVTNFKQAEGIRLNDLGGEKRTTFTLNTVVSPKNVFNSNLGYKIYNAEYGEGSIPVATTPFEGTEDEAIIQLDPNNPSKIIAKKAGIAVVRIYPLDRIISPDTELSPAWYVDVWVVVEDGVLNPYSIYTAEEFIAIGSSAQALTKNYVLMQTIDLSKYTDSLPIGKEFGSNFSGTLDTYRYGTNNKFSVVGIQLNNTLITENEVLGGLFGKISGKISNINFTFTSSQFDLTNTVAEITNNVLSVRDIYLGLLAGKIEGNTVEQSLENVEVKLSNYEDRTLYIYGIDDAEYTIYFGAVAGSVSGNLSTVYTEIAVQLDVEATKTFVGGLVGEFTGTRLGQTTDTLSKVKINVIRDNVYSDGSAIGGLIGVISKDSTIYSQNVIGSIVATNSINVGGLAGINLGTLGLFENNTEYRVLAGVKIQGYKNIGGLIGLNNGQDENVGIINYARVENYETTGLTPTQQALAIGIENVGGLVGQTLGGRITYSYAMSYVKQLTMTKYGTGDFYGDVVGASNVGGFIGLAKNVYIMSCFAKSNVQIVTDLGAFENYVGGGFVGKYEIEGVVSLANSVILNSYAQGKILTNNANLNETGELIGYYQVPETNSANYVDTCYAHVIITNISGENEIVGRNLIGTNVRGANVSNCFYLADTTDTNSGAVSSEDMVVNFEKGDYNTSVSYISWSFGDKDSTSAWVEYDPTLDMVGVNDDLPLLYDYDRSWLYNQAITDIQVTALTYKDDEDLLPTYFQFNGAGATASVVVLENIDLDENGNKSLYLYNTNETRGMFDIQVLPEIDPEKWSISVTSSNYAIAEIQQNSLNLLNAKIIFKRTGLVTITFQSLLDVSEKQEVLINVIGGFSNYDLLDENDNSLIADGQNELLIKKGYGKVLLPIFTTGEYTDSLGLKYETVSADYFDFVNYPFENGSTYVLTSTAHLLNGKESIDYQEVFVTPYVALNFGDGKTYNHVFTELKKNFYVKVYNGISSAGLSAKEATLTSSENLTIKLEVVTDNTATVQIDEPIIYKNGADTPLQDNSEVLTALPQNSEENITDELITNRYLLQLDESNRALTSQVAYEILFNVYDENGILYGTYTFNLVFIPSPIIRVDISHYTYGVESMENGEVSSNLISPGTKGLLKIETTPYYAYYDYMLVSSSIDNATGQKVQLMQAVNQNGKFKTLEAQYNQNGALITQKITGYDSTGNAYFNGIIYVVTLVGSNLLEGTSFIVSATAMRNGESAYVFPPTQFNLITTFTPYATLTLDNSNGDTVARGTVANFRLQGILYNSTITVLSADYGLGLDLTKTQLCVFGDVRKTFGNGQKENVDILIPFYVGILASPNNSKITITLQIDSTTSTGGMLNPLILQYTIYIVDYAIDSVYVNDAQSGVLNASIRTYSTLQAGWNLVTPSITDFENYIGASEEDLENFRVARDAILESAERKLSLINGQGDGQGGVWWFNNGTGYTTIQSAYSYTDFIVSYTTMNDGNSYYIIKGKNLTSNLDFKLYYKGYYVYDALNNCFCFTLESELAGVASQDILASYQNIFEQLFRVNIINNTTDDTPDLVDSVEKFRSMPEGASYMLTTDLVLDNWTPINTAITSLDGNGHIIYLRSFAQNTKTGTVNYGLFDTLQKGTVIKNLIIDVSYNIFVDLQNTSNVNFGFIAGVNDGGIIYNCDVVVTQSKENWTTIYNNTTHIASNNSNFAFASSIFNQMLQGKDQYVDNNTLASTFILTDKSSTSNVVTTYIGGLVGVNSGYITNCRIGRVDGNILGVDRVDRKYALQGINIFASGNVGGLVGQNKGVISNSYFANGTVVNYSMSIFSQTNQNGAKTGGLVADQTSAGRIESSYAVGQIGDTAQASLGGIKAYGTIGGLVHSNAGSIKNSYANMPLSSSNAMGGFVYQNTGKASVEYCYSMSKINSSGLINGVFTGVDQEGNVLNSQESVVKDCYYLATDNNFVDANEPATAISSLEWSNAQGIAFDGFAIADNETSTWYINAEKTYLGPQLRFADKVMYSFRSEDYTYDSTCVLGSESNPLIIADIEDWQNIFYYPDLGGTMRSPYMDVNPNYSTGGAQYVFGDYYVNLVADIDFGKSMHSTSYDTIFEGKFFGNGYNITGLNYRQTSSITTTRKDFGLFNSIENGFVTNLNINVANEITIRARHVGTLAGSANNVYLENITISGQTTNSYITGLNMVGSLVGLVLGDSEIRNIESSISVNAISATATSGLYNYYYRSALNKAESDFSYAGGIIGVVDLNEEENSEQNPRIQNLVTRGNANIYGEIAGGVLGLLDSTSEAKQLEFIIEADTQSDINPNIRGSNFSGGLIGENRGRLLNSRIGLKINTQIQIDTNISSTDNARTYIGYTGLFASNDKSTAVGGLVGLNAGGWINNSYSRATVYAKNAYIAGGIIGLAINAPNSYVPTDNDATLKYLRNLSNIENVFNDTGMVYSLESSKIKTKGAFSFSATLKEVYTTGAVNAEKVIGGVVGANIGAPMFANSTEALIAGINNFDAQDLTFTSKLDNADYYIGGLVGYLGFKVNDTNEGVVPLVSSFEISGEYSLGTASQKSKVVGSVAGKNIKTIGNVTNPNHTTSTIDFLTVATDPEDKTFDGFNETVWDIDKTKTSHRFAILKASYSATVSNIETAQQLLEFLSNTNTNSYGKIVKDNLVVTGTDWANYVVDTKNSKYTIATSMDEAVTGRLEGAVPYTVEGQSTTKSATVIFRDFSSAQAKAFDSLFGFTKNFRVLNINFVFEFTPDLTENGVNVTKNPISNFGLLAQESNSTYYENISLTFNNDNTLKTNNLENLALIVGLAQSCNFTNVNVNGKIETIENYSSTSAVNIGALFGLGKVTNTISGTTFGNFALNYTSNNNYSLNFGGLAGQADGILNVRGVVLEKQNNLDVDITVTANNNTNALNIAGVVGNITGTARLQNFVVDGEISINRTNGQDNSVSNMAGIVGSTKNTNIANVASLVNISGQVNGGSVYAGGVAGQIINEQEFTGTGTTMQFSGYLTEYVTNKGNISLQANSNNSIFIGGIFGYAENDLILANSKVVPSGQPRLIYNGLYSSGKLQVSSASNRIYAGGLIGSVVQGRLQGVDGYVELDKPNNILKISDSAFMGQLLIENLQSSNSYNALGGIAGNTQLAIADSLSNGVVSFDAENAISIYAGGMAGITNNDITYSITTTSVQARVQSVENISAIGAICGLQQYDNSRIVYTYYSAEMSGLLDNFGTNLTAMQMLNADNFKVNNVQVLTTDKWTFATESDVNGNAQQCSILYPKAVANNIDTARGGYVTPYIIQDLDMLEGLMAEDTQTEKTVIFDVEEINITQLPKLEISNVRKIIGNGLKIIVAPSNFVGSVDANIGLFAEIPKNVVVSSITLDISQISIRTSSNFNFGGIAGTNNGGIYNCIVGSLTAYTPKINYASNFVDIKTKFEDNFAGLIENSQSIFKFELTDTSNASLGTLVGVNKGNIFGSFVIADISVNNASTGEVDLGGIAGKMQNSWLSNSISQGRVIIKNVTNSSRVGGVVGQVVGGRIDAVLANSNVMTFNGNKNYTGFAFGLFSGISNGVVVNQDISGNLSINDVNNFYNSTLTTAELLAGSKFNSIVKNSVNQYNNIWVVGDTVNNYGYPYLNTLKNISLNTGDGTISNPYQLREGTELIRATMSNATGKHFVLVRDSMISSAILETTSKSTVYAKTLSGDGHIVLVNKYIEPSSSGGTLNIGLFRVISEQTSVSSLGVVFNEFTISNTATINFGGIACENKGTISNCSAVGLGKISLASLSNSKIGGLVGQNSGGILNSWADIDFEVKDGFVGGLVGLLGKGTSANTESTAYIRNCFANGNITANQDTSKTSYKQTSIGGLVGLANAYLASGRSIENCYVYGSKIQVAYTGSYVGALIGNAVKFNTYRTYAYVYTPGRLDTGKLGAGNYENLAMTGNVIEGAYDNTSIIAVWLGVNQGEVGSRKTENDLCPVTSVSIMRSTAIGSGCYAEWITSNWTRNMGVGNMNEYLLYLNEVTPIDKQETNSSDLSAESIFEYF